MEETRAVWKSTAHSIHLSEGARDGWRRMEIHGRGEVEDGVRMTTPGPSLHEEGEGEGAGETCFLQTEMDKWGGRANDSKGWRKWRISKRESDGKENVPGRKKTTKEDRNSKIGRAHV